MKKQTNNKDNHKVKKLFFLELVLLLILTICKVYGITILEFLIPDITKEQFILFLPISIVFSILKHLFLIYTVIINPIYLIVIYKKSRGVNKK